MKTYVTYGLGKFDKSKLVVNLSPGIQGKPVCAFWGSPIDSEYGWKDWCEANEFYGNPNKIFSPENTITWTLEDDSKILDIESIDDLENYFHMDYIKNYQRWPGEINYNFDFVRILKDGYSAIELHDSAIGHMFFLYLRNEEKHQLDMMMNSWDCESIVVLDPDKIKIIE